VSQKKRKSSYIATGEKSLRGGKQRVSWCSDDVVNARVMLSHANELWSCDAELQRRAAEQGHERRRRWIQRCPDAEEGAREIPKTTVVQYTASFDG
jgi:hypothetical protein